jgi:ADP-ribose pyrophosphatase YjhB (NUDIX family)
MSSSTKWEITSFQDLLFLLKVFQMLSQGEIDENDLEKYQNIRDNFSFLSQLNKTTLGCWMYLKKEKEFIKLILNLNLDDYLEGLKRVDILKDLPLLKILRYLNERCSFINLSFTIDSQDKVGILIYSKYITPEGMVDKVLLVKQDRWDPIEEKISYQLSQDVNENKKIKYLIIAENWKTLDYLLNDIYSQQDLLNTFNSKWSVPKGSSMLFYNNGDFNNELPELGASREMKEETGLDLSPQFISTLPYKNLHSNRYFILELEKYKGEKEIETIKKQIEKGFNVKTDSKETIQEKNKLKKRILLLFSLKDNPQFRDMYLQNIKLLKELYQEISDIQMIDINSISKDDLNNQTKKLLSQINLSKTSKVPF